MPTILDPSGQPMNFVNVRLPSETESDALVGYVPCSAGKFLAADDDARVRVLARVGGVGSFIDLAASPIALSTWSGRTIPFEFKLHANAFAGETQINLRVRVTSNP